MFNLNPVTRTRVEHDGTVTKAEVMADVHGTGKVFLDADADVEVGDELTYPLPNGKPRTIRIVEHNVYGVGSGMEHTKCLYEVVTAKTLSQPTPVTLPGLHPLISAASGSQVATKHYDDAVFNGLKAVEDRVKTLTGHTDIGKRLMSAVFNESAPLLDVTSDNADAGQQGDEREGYKFLFMGAAMALRNTRGHGPNLQTGEQEAMEMLATASLLMRALDRAEQRKQNEQKTGEDRPLHSGATGRQMS